MPRKTPSPRAVSETPAKSDPGHARHTSAASRCTGRRGAQGGCRWMVRGCGGMLGTRESAQARERDVVEGVRSAMME